MASINNTPTVNAGTLPLNDLITRLVLGATTIERGLVRVVPNAQDKVELATFRVDNDKLKPSAETQTTGNDSMHKGKVIIQTNKIQWFDTFNPITDLENDWSSFWHSGSMNQAQLNAKIKTYVISETAKSVANGVEKLMWQGDTGSGSAWLAMIDGFEKLLTAAVAETNNVTDLTVAIDKTNIIAVLQALIDVTPAAVLEEQAGSKFVLSHRLKQIYYEASRDIAISKGINIFETGTPKFAGYDIVSTGISDNKILFGLATSGKDSVLQSATWMTTDMSSVKIERTETFSDLWGALYNFRLGVNIVNPDQISYYDGTVA